MRNGDGEGGGLVVVLLVRHDEGGVVSDNELVGDN